SVMVFSFARVSAAVGMRRQGYFRQGVRGWLRLHEKGGKRHDVPAHHRAEEAMEAYVAAAGLEDAGAPLFQSVDRTGRLSGRPLGRRAVLAMIKRRAVAAGLPASTCCHTFRTTGITAYLSNGGTLEHAQRIAGHASPKTTKLYDRTADAVSLDEIERIVI
ncbi:MAG: tyrosine-type recombinase/integrase, partial [Acidobacteria bacterium]|nr:tyrosine-type recombinase/integrase [Acidobacteriota bacterium]